MSIARLRRAFAQGGIGHVLLEMTGLRHKLQETREQSRKRPDLALLALRGLPDLSLDWMVKFAHGAFLARGAESWTATLAGQRAHRYSFAGTGRGPSVLLLHGLAGSASSMAVLVPELLPLCRRVVLLEMPGHGRAPHAAGGSLSVRQYADVALAALDELSAHDGPAVVIGNSLGGALALIVAAERPSAVAGVIGLNPAGAAIDFASLPKPFDDPGAGAFVMAELLFHRPPLLFWLVARDYARTWGGPVVQRVMTDGAAGDSERELGAERLSSIRAPVLILWGEQDRLLPRSSIDYFRRHLGLHAVEVIPACGHVPQLERPALTRRRIRTFLQELSRVGAAAH